MHSLLKLRRHAAVAAVSLLLAAPALRAQDQAEKTPLAQKMTAINGAFRTIGRQIEDSTKNASTLEQIAIIETNAKAALAFEPEKKAQIPPADQAKFVEDFKVGIQKLVDTAAKLREAVAAGKNTDAAAIVKEMSSLQRESHTVFRIRKAPPGV